MIITLDAPYSKDPNEIELTIPDSFLQRGAKNSLKINNKTIWYENPYGVTKYKRRISFESIADLLYCIQNVTGHNTETSS